jgi:HNH endonuclease
MSPRHAVHQRLWSVHLAARVLDLYWYQVRPFEERELRQVKGSKANILDAVRELRTATTVGISHTALAVARARNEAAYQDALDKITVSLAEQPLRRLQTIQSMPSMDRFLYDDSFLKEHMSLKRLAAHGGAIRLRPGVAHGLARLAGLLKPTLQMMWVDDVRRINNLDANVPDVEGHLFGRQRIDLSPVRGPLKDTFGGRCFYCTAKLQRDNPIDHVLPWSLVGIDGLSNLVLACVACNSDKSNALPAVSIIDEVLDPGRTADLEPIAAELTWPTQCERVTDAARGIYRAQPGDVPTWFSRYQTVQLDLSGYHGWLQASV